MKEEFDKHFNEGGLAMQSELGQQLKQVLELWKSRILEMKMAHASTNVEAVADQQGKKGNVRDHVKSLGIHELHELQICAAALKNFIENPNPDQESHGTIPPGIRI